MPDVQAQIVRGHVQDLSIAYKNTGYIASEVYPRKPIENGKMKITKYNRGDAFRDEAQKRAPGTETLAGNWKVDTVDVNSYQYAHKSKVTKEDLRAAGSGVLNVPIDLQQEAVETSADKLDLKAEILTAANVFASTWVDGSAGGEDADAKWTASSGNTFLADVDKAILAIKNAGVPRDRIRLMMDDTTFQGVIRISSVTATLSYTAIAKKAPGLVITADMLASLLTIDKVVIGSAIYNTANEAQAGDDFTVSNIWGGTKGKAFVYYMPPRITRKVMCAGLQCFEKMENNQRRVTYKWYNNDKHTWFFESQEEMGPGQVCAYAGYAFKDTHTT